jgi:hypothetical protein
MFFERLRALKKHRFKIIIPCGSAAITMLNSYKKISPEINLPTSKFLEFLPRQARESVIFIHVEKGLAGLQATRE